MAISEKMSPSVKSLMSIALMVKGTIGFSMGVYEATCGAYFYERFGASINAATAIMLATLLLSVRQGLITLLEMPTGALADTIGRVQVVVISWIARTAFFICLAAMWFCDSVPWAVTVGVVASIFWAICYTCFNGAFSAWCVDYLKENAPEYPYSMVASYSHNYYTTAAAIGTPIGILFYMKGYPSLIYVIVGVLCFLCMGYCLMMMKETKTSQFVDRGEITMSSILQKMRGKLWNSCVACRQRPALFWILLTFGSFMFLLGMIKFLWPIFLKETTGEGKWGWMWIWLAMGCDIACAISSRIFVVISKKINQVVNPLRRLSAFSWIFSGISIVSAMAVIGNGYATAHQVNGLVLFVLTILTVVICYGFMVSCFETLVNHYIGDSNDHERATIISSGSFIRAMLFVFLAVPSSGSAAAQSPVYWAIPACLLLVSATASWFMVAREQKEEPIASTVL